MKDLIDSFKVFFTSLPVFIAILLVVLVWGYAIDASAGWGFLFIAIPLWVWLGVVVNYHIETEKEKRGYNARRQLEKEYKVLGKAMNGKAGRSRG